MPESSLEQSAFSSILEITVSDLRWHHYDFMMTSFFEPFTLKIARRKKSHRHQGNMLKLSQMIYLLGIKYTDFLTESILNLVWAKFWKHSKKNCDFLKILVYNAHGENNFWDPDVIQIYKEEYPCVTVFFQRLTCTCLVMEEITFTLLD